MNRQSRTAVLGMLAGASLSLGGCAARMNPPASAAALDCAAGLSPYVRNELYFGLSSSSLPNGEVTEAMWNDFSRDVLTAHFRDGMTVIDAKGQWRAADGRHVAESTKLVIVHFPAVQYAAAAAAVSAVITEAKRRFAQESVLWEERPVCAAF